MEHKVRAELKSLFSPDADPLENFAPSGPFGILVQAMIGPAGELGHESFDFMLCTPEWFAARMPNDITIGRHHVFMKGFNYSGLEKFVQDYCSKCEGESWRAVAEKIGRLGKWEFEDYVPYREPPIMW